MATISRPASVLVSADDAGDTERAGADRNRDSAAARILRIALALLIAFASVAFADDKDDAAKLKAFRDLNPQTSGKGVPGKRVEWHSTYVDLHYFGVDWRIIYLPFLAPLPGASLRDAGTIPNAFEQLGMQNAASTMPPAFSHDRSAGVEKEFKRIEKLSKQAQVVVTSSEGSH